jgi:hypothetical protein
MVSSQDRRGCTLTQAALLCCSEATWRGLSASWLLLGAGSFGLSYACFIMIGCCLASLQSLLQALGRWHYCRRLPATPPAPSCRHMHLRCLRRRAHQPACWSACAGTGAYPCRKLLLRNCRNMAICRSGSIVSLRRNAAASRLQKAATAARRQGSRYGKSLNRPSELQATPMMDGNLSHGSASKPPQTGPMIVPAPQPNDM